jgi:hypothetical protein
MTKCLTWFFEANSGMPLNKEYVFMTVLKRSSWGNSAKVAERYPDRALPCIAAVYENIWKLQTTRSVLDKRTRSSEQ